MLDATTKPVEMTNVCFSCKSIFSTNRSLIRHLRLTHPHQSFYKCIDNNCARSFNSLNSFLRRLRGGPHVDVSAESSMCSVDTLPTGENFLVQSSSTDDPCNIHALAADSTESNLRDTVQPVEVVPVDENNSIDIIDIR